MSNRSGLIYTGPFANALTSAPGSAQNQRQYRWNSPPSKIGRQLFLDYLEHANLNVRISERIGYYIWHEIGKYDLKKCLDYATNITQDEYDRLGLMITMEEYDEDPY